MNEFMSNISPKFEKEQTLQGIITEYMPEDADFLADMDFEDALGYVYGQLLEMGEDPDEILREAGVTEADDEI